MIRLITRGDDAGSNVTANRAIRDACVDGVLRNVSVMVSCGGALDAADRLRDLDEVCIGLHATMNAEWSRVRWGAICEGLAATLVHGSEDHSVFRVERYRGDPV